MTYVQIWLRVSPNENGLTVFHGSDEPIKHPCHPPVAADTALSNSLGAENVQVSTPAFFIEDPTVWTLLGNRARDEKKTVAEVITEAVQGQLTPPAAQ